MSKPPSPETRRWRNSMAWVLTLLGVVGVSSGCEPLDSALNPTPSASSPSPPARAAKATTLAARLHLAVTCHDGPADGPAADGQAELRFTPSYNQVQYVDLVVDGNGQTRRFALAVTPDSDISLRPLDEAAIDSLPFAGLATGQLQAAALPGGGEVGAQLESAADAQTPDTLRVVLACGSLAPQTHRLWAAGRGSAG